MNKTELYHCIVCGKELDPTKDTSWTCNECKGEGTPDIPDNTEMDDKTQITINITFGALLDSGCWGEFCDERGYDPWIMNDGLADGDEMTTITLKQAKKWGII